MKQTRAVEFGTGLFALLGMGALFFLTTQTTGGDDFHAEDTYTVEARFQNVGSLRPRAPVAMSGVTIGRVTDITSAVVLENLIGKFLVNRESESE